MARFFRFFSVALIFCTLFPFSGEAANEIKISTPEVRQQDPARYEVLALVQNISEETREVVIRTQIFFFEEGSPDGDLPVMVLRKDDTLVLKGGENRNVMIRLINEGTLPKARLRLKPEVRIRRQRVWNY